VRSPADTPRRGPRPGRGSAGLTADSRRSGEQPGTAQAERAWGSRPGRLGPITVIFGALVGGLLTVLAGFEPGWLLGLFVIMATVAGASAVRRTSAYLVIPVPALAYFVVAVIAGLIHDRGVDTSRAILFVNAVQWIAGGFFWMCLATVIAIAISAGRWLMTGQAGYRGGLWLARSSRAWAEPDATGPGASAGAARAPAARPDPARSNTARSNTAGSNTARSGTARPEDARREDASAGDGHQARRTAKL
jgi:hypothetical protein